MSAGFGGTIGGKGWDDEEPLFLALPASTQSDSSIVGQFFTGLGMIACSVTFFVLSVIGLHAIIVGNPSATPCKTEQGANQP